MPATLSRLCNSRLEDSISTHSFMIDGSPLGKEKFKVCLHKKFNRTELEQQKTIIEDTWLYRTQDNPRLHNGDLYRFDSITGNTLNLGFTCYKDFLGTNYAPNCNELRVLGTSNGNSQKYLADPLGVGALIITKDDQLVLTRRARWTAEYPGSLDIPGGHPEPKLAGCEVLQEVFGSVEREVIDEVNIPGSSLNSPLLMGLVRNENSGGRPNLQFLMSCSLTSKDIKQLYLKGCQKEADETTEIVFISNKDVKQELQSDDLWKQLTPSAKGALYLYSQINK